MNARRGLGLRLAALVAALTMVVAACSGGGSGAGSTSTTAGSGSDSTTTTTGGGGGEQKTGGVLRVLMKQDEGQGFDPAILTFSTGFVIAQQMFDSLAEITPSGEIVPSLAERWDVSDDGLTYTFHIRPGVKFHNGDPLTAEDVKFTIDRIRDPETQSPRIGIYAVVESVEATDELTVVIRLKEPFAPLLSALADITAGIVSKSAVGAAGADFYRQPVGTGAFMMKEWNEGQYVELVRFDEYWDGDKPYLDGITFTFNNDDNARAAALRAGDIDFLYDAPVPLKEILEGDPSVEIYAPEGQMAWLYFLVNPHKAPFDDVRVRQAIFEAIDRQQLADLCYPGLSTALNAGFLPAGYWAANPEVMYTGNVEKAKGLLEEAGYGDGFSFTINSLTGWDFQNCTAQGIQEQLRPLGIEIEVRILEAGQLTGEASAADKTSNEAFEAMILGFSGTIDPDERFQQSFMPGGGTNWGGFTDDELAEIVTKARQTFDRDERAELYRQAQHRLAEVGPYAFLYSYHKLDAAQSYVKDYVFNPNLISYRQLRDVWFDQ